MPESYQNPAGQTKFESFIRWFFLIVFTCVILFLFFLALTKSTAIDIDEVCHILADNPIKGLAVILIGMAAVCILKEYTLKHPPRLPASADTQDHVRHSRLRWLLLGHGDPAV